MNQTRACPGCGAPIGRAAACCGRCFDGLPLAVRRALTTADPLQDVTTYLNARNAAADYLRRPQGAPS